MSLNQLLLSLQHSQLGNLIGTGPWVFPSIETVHVLSLAIVFGSIAILDLRLLGLASRKGAVSMISHEVLPFTWIAFAISAVSGSLLFVSNAPGYIANLQFRWKFILMALAAINMLVFHFGAYRTVLQWDNKLPPPPAARLAGGLSLLLWLAIIVMGRWTGYTMQS